MSAVRPPTLAIGLPVYNGAQFVAAALDAMRAQSYDDFELIIVDNASTDATEAVCRAQALSDRRIRYHRNARNVGPAANFNCVFGRSSSRFFKWMAHDDLHHPDYLARCMEALDKDPNAILAYSRAVTIDPEGTTVRKPWGAPAGLTSSRAPERFRAALAPPTEPLPLPIFGIVRSQVLRKTALQCALPASDLALIAELTLHGRFVEIPEPLFRQREHPGRAGPHLSQDPYRAAAFWRGAGGARVTYPHWRLLRRHLDSIARAPLSATQARDCRRALRRWAWHDRELLLRDTFIARREDSRLTPLLRHVDSRLRQRRWQRKTRRLESLLTRALPADATVVVADDGQLSLNQALPCHVLPFIERRGAYWGAPADNAEAWRELQRAIENGASHFVVAWPAFWWLDYYRDFFEHLRAKSACVFDTEVAKAYRLRR
jgi:glycosyltransferase involved in cell wall biosynthesis